MISRKFLKFSAYCAYGLLRLFGLAPFTYNKKKSKFEVSTVSIIQGVCVVTIIVLTYPTSYTYITGTLNESLASMKNVNAPFVLLNVLILIIMYLTQIIISYELVKGLNFIKQIHKPMTEFLLDDIESFRLIVLGFCTKLFLLPFLIEMVIIVRSFKIAEHISAMHVIHLINVMLPVLIRSIIPTCLFGGLLISTLFAQKINGKVATIIEEVNLLVKHEEASNLKHYNKVKRFCELSDRLDELAYYYGWLCKITKIFMKLGSVPLLVSILFNFYVIIIELYLQYLLIGNALLKKERYPIFDVLSGYFFAASIFAEVFLEASAATANVNEIQGTGVILHGALLSSVDVRLKRSIETFSLNILQRNYEITICGFFNMDQTLIHDAVASSAGFLLLLIQFELADRFAHLENKN